LAWALGLGLIACSNESSLGASESTDNVELTVFAAASLTDAVTELGEAFEAAHPGVNFVFNFGSSSQLATQLAEGATADVFASANEKQMQVAVDAGRIAGEPLSFTTNQLVVIVPADNPGRIATLDDLATPGIRLVLATPGVPVRDYGDQMLENLAADPAYGPAFRDAVYANLVSEEDNVRQVAAKVALGEADAGIVYVSDVTPDIRDAVQQIAIPEQYNVIATYPIGLIADAPHPEQAQAFINFVLDEEGQAILARWRFGRTPVD
jgi:molybdate transport system substrate-binding protein